MYHGEGRLGDTSENRDEPSREAKGWGIPFLRNPDRIRRTVQLIEAWVRIGTSII